MRIILKVFKWIGLSIGSLLLFVVLVGLSFRLLGPGLHLPMGALIDIGGFRLHIQADGKKSQRPTLVIEGGSGMASEYYHWLSEGLKGHMRVIRYDRAGIGYSDKSDTPRDPETIARELHTLLEKAGESPPYILAGHSIGGPYISVFRQLYPDEVQALVFIDPTHPERVERLDLPKKSSSTFKSIIWAYNTLGILGDTGLLGIYVSIWGPIIPTTGLPEDVAQRTLDFFRNGKLAWTAAKETLCYHRTLKRAAKASDFGSLPIRFFKSNKPASEKAKKIYKKRGIDLEKRGREERKMVDDFIRRSSDSKLILIDGDHNSMYTIKENAAIICKETLLLYQELSH